MGFSVLFPLLMVSIEICRFDCCIDFLEMVNFALTFLSLDFYSGHFIFPLSYFPWDWYSDHQVVVSVMYRTHILNVF